MIKATVVTTLSNPTETLMREQGVPIAVIPGMI